MFFGISASVAELNYTGAPRFLGAKSTIIYSNLTTGSLSFQLRNAGSNPLTDNDVTYARHIKPRVQARHVPAVNSVGVDEMYSSTLNTV